MSHHRVTKTNARNVISAAVRSLCKKNDVLFTVRVHVIPWHLRWGQALSEGVHVKVLLLHSCEFHLLLLDVGVGRSQVLQL